MSFARFILLFLPVLAHARTELTAQDYEGLSRRFVSTIKETQVDSQMLSVPAIQTCVEKNRIEEADLADTTGYPTKPDGTNETKSEKKRREARACFQQSMAQASDSDLTNLADKLKLDQFGLVEGKGAKQVTDYFAKRIESAIYGTGSEAEVRRLRDRTIVDHNVFMSIYESRASKNFLLEVSRYCSQELLPTQNGSPVTPSSPAFFTAWRDISRPRPGGAKAYCSPAQTPDQLSQSCFPSRLTDTNSPAPSSAPASAAPAAGGASSAQAQPDVYANFAQVLKSPGGVPEAELPDTLRSIFETCISLVPAICELRVYCEEVRKANAAGSGTATQALASRYPQYQNVSCPSDTNFGAKSCVMQQKIRSYRVSVSALEQIKRDNPDLPASKNGNFQVADGTEIYTNNSASGDRSVEGISTVTASDMQEVNERVNTEYEAQFDQAGCESRPEDKACEAFFYTKDEATKFANQGILYDAATEREKASIKKLSGDDLKKYLTEKGYGDLKAKLESGGTVNEADIVAMAQARFETEREAAYKQMANAFGEKQTLGKQQTDIEDMGKQAVQKNKDQTNQLNQLVLFNNVVTSFVTVRDAQGQDRSNSAVLQQELRGDGINPQALEFFSNLSGTSTGGGSGGSGGGGNETVTVDLNFLDGILSGETGRQQAPN